MSKRVYAVAHVNYDDFWVVAIFERLEDALESVRVTYGLELTLPSAPDGRVLSEDEALWSARDEGGRPKDDVRVAVFDYYPAGSIQRLPIVSQSSSSSSSAR